MSNELTINQKKTSLFDADQFPHWMSVAEKLSRTTMIPKGYTGKPMEILVAWEMGDTLGLSKMQALQSIAVINGMPSIYGDAPLAICQQHPGFEWIKEEPILNGKEVIGYQCTVKRKNNEPHCVEFTRAHAKKAGLLGKPGPWTQYEERMLQFRARGFALRDVFPDALKGIKIKEEIEDITYIDAEWTPKKTQSEKMQALLTKKGFNHEKEPVDSEVVSNGVNPDIPSEDDRLQVTNFLDKAETIQTETCEPMAENGESENSIAVEEDVSGQCTDAQLEDINGLLALKGLDKARKLKALDHFNVTSFEQLTKNQAAKMINILERIE